MFVGRKQELKDLESLWGRNSGVLVTCRGRRRIGKSSLIEEFAHRSADTFISIDGLPPRKGMTDEKQRENFCEKVAEFTGGDVEYADTWSLAFSRLNAAIPESGRTVVLLDEISWLGGYNPDFAGYLKEAWDRKFRKHSNLVFVLCGSVSAWIVENILNSTGFVGRDSLDIELRELNLKESAILIGATGDRISSSEVFDLLSVTGGVPKYLDEVRIELSADENIRRLCFRPRGLLFREFDDSFNCVFGSRVASRGEMLRLLASGPKSAAELADAVGRDVGGNYTRVLRDLQYAGFIARDSGINPTTGKPLREARYRISDNYARFYLHFVEPRKQAIEAGLFELMSTAQLTGWHTALGIAFENLIVNHVNDLFPELGLDRALVLSAAPYIQNATARNRGCQIDLLIQTERMIMVVEIKRRKQIQHGIIDEVAEKVRRLKYDRRKSIRTALVYDGELSPSVAADRYFDFIVPAEHLLSE